MVSVCQCTVSIAQVICSSPHASSVHSALSILVDILCMVWCALILVAVFIVLLCAVSLHKHCFVQHCRHGDFFTAILKTQPAMINDWQSRQWSKFFCLSVYVTMYLNDHQRDAFYSSLGMNTTQFNQHVIIETNNTTARIFPEVGFTLILENSISCCIIADSC